MGKTIKLFVPMVISLPASHRLAGLQWLRLKVVLRATESTTGEGLHPFFAAEAIVKQASAAAGFSIAQDEATPGGARVFFHLNHLHHKARITAGHVYPMEILFTRCPIDMANRWREELEKALASPLAWRGRNRFTIEEIGQVEPRNWMAAAEGFSPPGEGEICLEFLSPLPFKSKNRKAQDAIGFDRFIKSLTGRFEKLFGGRFEYVPGDDDFKLIPCYWSYKDISRISLSQGGGPQLINGYIGKLYIKGRYDGLMPYLILGAELHAGLKISYSRGYYLLHDKPTPHFSSFFPSPAALALVIRETAENQEDWTGSGGFRPQDPEAMAIELASLLENGEYLPEPSDAFMMRKNTGGHRLVERLKFADLAVQRYIYKTIRKPIEKALEKESIGFRRGLSREMAIELVADAVKDGFRHAIRTDIDECFPSVDLDVLDGLIDLYFPAGDAAMRALLKKFTRTGYLLDGKQYERSQGLAQGAPLSPLLLNLYLDSLDEKIKASGARLIRYADDILIFTRTADEARETLAGATGHLAALGLRLDPEKTRIMKVEDGFDFLGYNFIGGEVCEGGDDIHRQYKKPLYVTSAYNFVSINGSAVEISRSGKTIDLAPLHRINEIIVMENAAISTSLIKKAAESGVPITMTLGDGYHVATITPDSKKHLHIAAAHAAMRNSLPFAEHLAICREFARGKLENYATMIDIKRLPGLESVATAIRRDSARMEEIESVEALRGLEGAATRRIYQGLNQLTLNKRFHLHKRSRKQPDMINSLLNFGFYLLFSRINATVRAAGLNPYLGFLHSPADDYESLVCDIQELFRAETHNFIIRLINLRIIGADDFEDRGKDGMRLRGEGRVKFLNRFEELMERKPAAGVPSMKENIYIQISVIRSWVMDGGSLVFYRRKR